MEEWVKWTGVYPRGGKLHLGDNRYTLFYGSGEVDHGVNKHPTDAWENLGWVLTEVPFELENE